MIDVFSNSFGHIFATSFLFGFGVSTLPQILGLAIRYAKKILTISADVDEM